MPSYEDIYFPASGYGRQSSYYDDSLLFDGTYQIMTVTLDKNATDNENPEGSDVLRAGLLLTLAIGQTKYVVASSATGYLNGGVKLQRMHECVILATKEYMTKDFIMGRTRVRTITRADRIVPVYFSCNIFDNRVYYNNKTNVELTDQHWSQVQRLRLVPAGSNRNFSDKLRTLLYNRVEDSVPTT